MGHLGNLGNMRGARRNVSMSQSGESKSALGKVYEGLSVVGGRDGRNTGKSRIQRGGSAGQVSAAAWFVATTFGTDHVGGVQRVVVF